MLIIVATFATLITVDMSTTVVHTGIVILIGGGMIIDGIIDNGE
jgi:hypothetical protein